MCPPRQTNISPHNCGDQTVSCNLVYNVHFYLERYIFVYRLTKCFFFSSFNPVFPLSCLLLGSFFNFSEELVIIPRLLGDTSV